MPRPNSRDPEDDPAALLGRQLKRIRLAAKFTTQDALAKAMGYVREVVTKSETGDRPPTDDVFAKWLDVCGASDEAREFLTDQLKLARKTNTGVIPRWAEPWLKAEKLAEFLLLWSPVLVAGLLQIREYAHATFTLAGLGDDEAGQKATIRLERQAILDGPDPVHVTVLLHESVLDRLVGSPATMVAQLTHLLEMSQRRNVIIQIVRGVEYFFGLEGQFQIASGEGMPDTMVMVAVEDQTTEERAVVRKAIALFKDIQGRALTTEESRSLIMEALERWKSQQ